MHSLHVSLLLVGSTVALRTVLRFETCLPGPAIRPRSHERCLSVVTIRFEIIGRSGREATHLARLELNNTVPRIAMTREPAPCPLHTQVTPSHQIPS